MQANLEPKLLLVGFVVGIRIIECVGIPSLTLNYKLPYIQSHVFRHVGIIPVVMI